MSMSDATIICGACSRTFQFTARDQKNFADKGWQRPKKCKDCALSRARSNPNTRGQESWFRSPLSATDINESARTKAAGFLIGPLTALEPVMRNFSERNQKAIEDELIYAVAIPLRHIEMFFVPDSDLQIKGYGKNLSSAFYVSADKSPFYRGRNGEIEELSYILPSKVTSTMLVGSDHGRHIYHEIFRSLKAAHPDWYVLGNQYSNKTNNPINFDIQPFMTESREAKHGNERPAETAFRGFQEELQITLSDAKKAELERRMGPALGYYKRNGVYTELLYNVVLTLERGEGIDYSFVSTPAAAILTAAGVEARAALDPATPREEVAAAASDVHDAPDLDAQTVDALSAVAAAESGEASSE